MRPTLFATAAIVAASSGAHAAVPAFAMPVYTIGLYGDALGFMEDETVVVSEVTTPTDTVWIAERLRHETSSAARTDSTKHQWIDGRNCAALVGALDRLSNLPAAKFGTPKAYSVTGVAFDASLTSLTGPPAAPGGGISISRREFVGPLAEWRREMGNAVADCWRDEKVSIAGAEIPTRLSTQAEARSWRSN